jgi:vibriolysin
MKAFDGVDVKAKISTASAINALKAKFGVKNIQNLNVSLVIDAKTRQLAYKVDFLDVNSVSRPFGLVSAKDASIIMAVDAIAHKGKPGVGGGTTTPALATGPGGNEKTGMYYYGTDFPTLPVGADRSGTCYMESDNVKTVDMGNRTRRGNLFQFTCPDNSYQAVMVLIHR